MNLSFSRVPLLVWILIPTVVLIGVGVWFFTKSDMGNPSSTEAENRPAAVSASVEGTVDYDIVGRNHMAQGAPGSGYNSNPPTSGPHWAAPAKNGVYADSLPDEQLIHNLEHGHIWIAYKSDVSDDVKSKLSEIVGEEDWKIVMAPRDQNDTAIAIVAWGRVLKMDEPDYDKIRSFIRTYRNRGPERTPE